MLSLLKIRSILSFSIILFFLFSTVFILKIVLSSSYLDFQYYYVAVKTLVEGGNPYSLSYFPFPCPPAALLFFIPFTAFSPLIAGKLFFILSFICLFLSIIFLLRLFHCSVTSKLGIFLAALAFSFFPVKFSLISGQINTPILLLTVLFVYLYVKRHFYVSGGILACAVMLKFFPLILIPYLIIQKQWKTLLAFFGTILFITLIIAITIPHSVTELFFIKTLPSFFQTGGGAGYYDQSLSAFIARTLQLSIAAQLARYIAGVLLIITFFGIWLYRKHQNKQLLCISILLILNVILNNFAWQHHFIWLLIPLFITFFYIQKNRSNPGFYILLGCCYLLIGGNLKTPDTAPLFLRSHVFYGAFLLYCLNIYLLLSNNRSKKTILQKKSK